MPGSAHSSAPPFQAGYKTLIQLLFPPNTQAIIDATSNVDNTHKRIFGHPLPLSRNLVRLE